jgi:hypothetical protein
MERKIRIVSRDVIPLIQEVEQGGSLHLLGELRDFRWNAQLREFMPDAAEFSVSWVQLGPDEVLQPHTHPIQTMLVIYAGSGGVIGDLCRPLKKGDIVVVPAGCAHGFVGGPDRLSGLSIQFGQGLYSDPENAQVVFSGEGSPFEATARYNESRLAAFLRGPLFEGLSAGTLDDPERQRVHLDNLGRWRTAYQRALLAYHATSPGGDAIVLDDRSRDVDREGDVVLEAFADWFVYRMSVLDSHEKEAILHLVLGQAVAAYFRRATPALERADLSAVLEQVAGQVRVDQCLRRLRSLAPASHLRLRRILGEAWDMVEAMEGRMTARVRAA